MLKTLVALGANKITNSSQTWKELNGDASLLQRHEARAVFIGHNQCL